MDRFIKILAIIIISFLALVFGLLICMFFYENKPPGHESDWVEYVDIPYSKDILSVANDYAGEYANTDEMLWAELSFDCDGKNHESFSYYVPPKDGLPNGIFEIGFHPKEAKIWYLSMTYSENIDIKKPQTKLQSIDHIEKVVQKKAEEIHNLAPERIAKVIAGVSFTAHTVSFSTRIFKENGEETQGGINEIPFAHGETFEYPFVFDEDTSEFVLLDE